MISLFPTIYTSVELAYHEIFRAKVGQGGIISDTHVTDQHIAAHPR